MLCKVFGYKGIVQFYSKILNRFLLKVANNAREREREQGRTRNGPRNNSAVPQGNNRQEPPRTPTEEEDEERKFSNINIFKLVYKFFWKLTLKTN